MTERQQEKIITLHKKGAKYADIAAALHLSVGTVKSFCSRKTVNQSPSKCRCCGQTLNNTPGHRQKSYCSDRCRQKYWQEHKDSEKSNSLFSYTCPVCGKNFADYKGHHRKYCSHGCYIADRYRRDTANESE